MTLSAQLPLASAALDARLATLTSQPPPPVRAASAYVCDLEAMHFGQWQAQANIYPASVIKIPIMTEAFCRIAEGSLSTEQTITIKASNQTATGEATPFVPGYRASVGELVELMITHSDNVATNELIDLLRREQVTQRMHHLGLKNFLLGRKLSGSDPLISDPEETGRNRLAPADAGLLLQLIASDGVPRAAEQREILARCLDSEKLVAGLLPGDTFMHKTGETSTVSHDAGILQTANGNRYVVVLYCEIEPSSQPSKTVQVNNHMAQWMRSLREIL